MVNNSKEGQRVLEVGCGSGVGGLTFATVFLQQRGVLVLSDYSEKMMELAKQRFEASGFATHGNVAVFDGSDYTSGKKVELD
jgi:ubiquinone/menaquinone biosynthesis C-methylase UbiE